MSNIFFTDDFKNNIIQSEGGIKFSLGGYVIIKDKKSFLKRSYEKDNFKTLKLKETLNNTEVIFKNEKSDEFSEKIFPLTYIPALEYENEDDFNFGSYLIKISGGMTTGKVDAIILLGNKNKENNEDIFFYKKFYIAAILYFNDGLEIKTNTSKRFNFIFSYTKNDAKFKISGDFYALNENLSKDDLKTDKIKTNIFLTNNNKKYKEFENSLILKNNLVLTDSKKQMYNVKSRLNIFDDFTHKPQILISYSEIDSENKKIENQNFGVYVKQNNISLNSFPSNKKGNTYEIFSFSDSKNVKISPETTNLFRYNSKETEISSSNNINQFFSEKDNISGTLNYFSLNNEENNLYNNNSINLIDSKNNSLENVEYTTIIDSNKNNFKDIRNSLIISNENTVYSGFNNGVVIGKNEYSFAAGDKNILIGFKGLNTKEMKNSIIFGDNSSVVENDKTKIIFSHGFFDSSEFKKNKFDFIDDYVDKKDVDVVKNDISKYMKRLNIFSVEEEAYIDKIHFNDFKNKDKFFEETKNSFAIRSLNKISDSERDSNLQECYFSSDSVYFPKKNFNKEKWKLKIKEIKDFVDGKFVNIDFNNLNKNNLNSTLNNFNKKEKSYYLLKLKGQQYDYNGKIKNIISNLYDLKGLRNAIKGQHGKIISDDGIFGNDNSDYVFYCINLKGSNLYLKGLRMYDDNGTKKFLYNTKCLGPKGTQRIIYKNLGSKNIYGIVNFNYSDGNDWIEE